MTDTVRAARLSAEPLSVDRLLGLVADRTVGGVGLFVGIVRDHDGEHDGEQAGEQDGEQAGEQDGEQDGERDGEQQSAPGAPAEVVSLDYTAHPSAEVLLRATVAEVAARHDLVAVAVEHRIGHLEVGDLAVVVAAGAVHRQAALEATRELIDAVKQTVPIWKEQHYLSGRADWVGLP
jgi:molybdopterin synthase catalytic subunit